VKTQIVLQTDLPLPRFGTGKVRDTYDLGDYLLMVATDRISAFDCILPNGIPRKGEVLTQLSEYWFGQTSDLIPNHLLGIADLYPDSNPLFDVESDRLGGALLPPEVMACYVQVADRAMIVRKAQRIDFECVARGYLAGSAWQDYRATGAVCGIPLPEGLRQADRLPEPVFTPATKEETGHDRNVSLADVKRSVGEELGQALADATLAVYRRAGEIALDRGIIIADTKMEFGLIEGELTLIDELLTPDSSRFWALSEYAPGGSPPSFDKQFVRDYLERIGWNKQSPAPALPPDVVAGTAERYREAYEWLTGRWLTGRSLPPA
jgi:phosphoribosylaminoimidazole-succinocarboxamide synthase